MQKLCITLLNLILQTLFSVSMIGEKAAEYNGKRTIKKRKYNWIGTERNLGISLTKKIVTDIGKASDRMIVIKVLVQGIIISVGGLSLYPQCGLDRRFLW